MPRTTVVHISISDSVHSDTKRSIMGKKRWPLQSRLASLVKHATMSLAFLPRTRGMIHNLSISKDTRRMFQIESFGFREGGFMNLTVSEFSIEGPEPYRAGFIVTRTSTESSAQEELEDALEGGADNGDGSRDGCLLNKAGPNDLVLDLSERSTWEHRMHASRTLGAGQQGLYVLYFCLCSVAGDGVLDPEVAITKERGGSKGGEGEHRVSFKLRVELWNQGEEGARDYLSAGMWALPKLFLGMFGLFFAALLMWLQCLRRHTVHVHHIHHMMTVLLVFKTLSMLFESIRYHYLRLTGAAEAWSIVYYLFAFLKGITLFVVVLLIGTGWSLIKPFLNKRDKQIILVVLSLQVINNVAQIVLEETAPGSTVWLKWRNILHVVDIVCCCSILVPIMWSIRHLRQAALADGKAEHTIRRLNVFRHFYKMVLVYVYFTRIVLVLLSAMLPFEFKWLEQLSSELATLVFFVVTGWRFRPQPEAPYLPIGKDGKDEAMLGHYEGGEGGLEFQALRRESGKDGT